MVIRGEREREKDLSQTNLHVPPNPVSRGIPKRFEEKRSSRTKSWSGGELGRSNYRDVVLEKFSSSPR